MKSIEYFIAIVALTFSSCEEEKITFSADCFYGATVEDWTGLDGCGYLLKLDNGEYLEPIFNFGWCGTPPVPEDQQNAAFPDFSLEHGQKVRIGYKYAENQASICMKGTKAVITCIELQEPVFPEEGL